MLQVQRWHFQALLRFTAVHISNPNVFYGQKRQILSHIWNDKAGGVCCFSSCCSLFAEVSTASKLPWEIWQLFMPDILLDATALKPTSSYCILTLCESEINFTLCIQFLFLQISEVVSCIIISTLENDKPKIRWHLCKCWVYRYVNFWNSNVPHQASAFRLFLDLSFLRLVYFWSLST